MSIAITLLALLVEATLGYPGPVLRAIGHPVMWLGWLIQSLDDTLNRDTSTGAQRRAAGYVAAFVIVALPAAAVYAIESWLSLVPFGFAIVAIVASTLIAQRSLYEHVERVATALEQDGLAGGRRAVSQIVGRDPDALDEAGVARAAIESLAENFSDGVVAPVFWLGVGGLAGGVAYKAINTADSMIGHRTPRHGDFGFAAA
ncbi:MAG: adenosylcobinamide-phosphate synthase, partial [Alphaproteobacteria bacterium]|nr:adenosylcobinamide-phosphate synthase [Alphaproteobacteria bacterium]